MSGTKNAVELCALLVDETYGELSSRIFTMLLRRGRLTIHQLRQRTRLSIKQLEHGLAILVQQNLIYYQEHQDLKSFETTTHYEANQDAAYDLVRFGKTMEIVESRYGIIARDMVESLLLLGHAKVSDLLDAWQERSQVKGKTNGHRGLNGTNGTHGEACDPIREASSVLMKLLEAGLIQPIFPRMFNSPTDTQNRIEHAIEQTFEGGPKGVKQKAELKNRIRDKLNCMRSEVEDWKPKGKKRLLNGEVNGTNGNGKRRRLSYSDDEVNSRLDQDMIVRINFEKITVALRNERLVEFACERIGETTSYVYAEILRLMEENISRCRIDPKIDDVDDLSDGPSVTTKELLAALSPTIDVSLGIGKASKEKIDVRRVEKSLREAREQFLAENKAEREGTKKEVDPKKKNGKIEADGSKKMNGLIETNDPEMQNGDIEAEVEGEASPDEEESGQEDYDMNGNGNTVEVVEDDEHLSDDPFNDDEPVKAPKRAKVTFEDKLPRPAAPEDRLDRLMHLKNHLMVLAADECHFLRRCGSQGQGEWTVDFEPLVDHLRQSEIDFVILENFGKGGHRLVRMMRSVGMLDEKALPNNVLMTQKDTRTKLAEMQMAGMIDVQCVPRDTAHTIQRSIFLWYFDPDRVGQQLLDNLYKTMSRCLQRLEVERRKASGILSLAERTDVRDKVDEQLNAAQKILLDQFLDKEKQLLGQVFRLDGLVGIFRDY